MKKSILTLIVLLSGLGLALPAVADPPPYVDFRMDVSVDGDSVYHNVPVHTPDGALIGLSASSPKDDQEVVFRVATRKQGDEFEFAGRFEVKDQGKVIKEVPFGDIVKAKSEGKFELAYNGKTYVVQVRPTLK